MINYIKYYLNQRKQLKFFNKKYDIIIYKHKNIYIVIKNKYYKGSWAGKIVHNNIYSRLTLCDGFSFLSEIDLNYSMIVDIPENTLKFKSKYEAINAINRWIKIQQMKKACE